MNKKLTAITGAKGFLASAMSKRLEQEGYEVISVHSDIISDKLYHHTTLGGWRIPDEIYNFAGTPSPSKFLKNP